MSPQESGKIRRPDPRAATVGLPLGPSEVLIVDDDPSVRHMLHLGLEQADMPVMSFGEPVEALAWAVAAPASVVIVDLRIPEVDGLDLVQALCGLDRHAVIILSAIVDVSMTVEAMRLGAFNVLEKPASTDRIIRAVEEAQAAIAKPAQAFAGFTPRERQVAELIMDGQTTKQIAQALLLSPRTVEFFRANLLRKTGATNPAALVSILARMSAGG
ncbi:response regulator transcription factor [Brevundimonas lutea]|uniref:response regulator transcription factor n=1 Tax=Brevundimonas lutea TaxID=2293980 RepID=UPI000F012F7C|nr:response regulator [Brevundimonas lutea]